MELCPLLHLGVVAIEKRAFRSPLSKVANFTNFILHQFTNWWSYLPTPPLEQDMTQGQFLSKV